jgi:hypothetical protein
MANIKAMLANKWVKIYLYSTICCITITN